MLGLSEQGTKGAAQAAPADKKNPMNAKWSKSQPAGEPSEEDIAAKKKRALEALEKDDELEQERELRRAEKMATRAERSLSRGKSSGRGAQSRSP